MADNPIADDPWPAPSRHCEDCGDGLCICAPPPPAGGAVAVPPADDLRCRTVATHDPAMRCALPAGHAGPHHDLTTALAIQEADAAEAAQAEEDRRAVAVPADRPAPAVAVGSLPGVWEAKAAFEASRISVGAEVDARRQGRTQAWTDAAAALRAALGDPRPAAGEPYHVPEGMTTERLRDVVAVLDDACADDASRMVDGWADALDAAAPGSDPAPKVGDRVRDVDGDEGTVIAWWVRYEGLGEVPISTPLTVISSGAPVGVSETEGDQPEPEAIEPACSRCGGSGTVRPAEGAARIGCPECGGGGHPDLPQSWFDFADGLRQELADKWAAGSDQDGERR